MRKTLVATLLLALVVVAAPVFAAGTPAGKFWSVVGGIPEKPEVSVSLDPVSPATIKPGEEVELIRFAVSAPKEVLITDIVYSFFYDGAVDAPAGVDEFSLWVGEPGVDDTPSFTRATPPITPMDNPQTIRFFMGDSIALKDPAVPILFSVRGNIWGTGTIQQHVAFKALSPYGHELEVNGLPIEQTIPVSTVKITAVKAPDSPTGEIPTGTDQPALNINILAKEDNVQLETLDIVLETDEMGLVDISAVSLWHGATRLDKRYLAVGAGTINTTLLFPPPPPGQSPLVLIDGVVTSLTLKVDVQGRGNIRLGLIGATGVDSTGAPAVNQNLNVVGNDLQVLGPMTFEVPGEISAFLAFDLAKSGDTIHFAPGGYDLNGKGGMPHLPGGVTVEGTGTDQTFLFGRIGSYGEGGLILKNLRILDMDPVPGAAVSAGKLLTLENVEVVTAGPVALRAGWAGVILNIQDSVIVNLAGGTGVEVAGELNAAETVIIGNTFINQQYGVSAPVADIGSFASRVLKNNTFYKVNTPVHPEAFG